MLIMILTVSYSSDEYRRTWGYNNQSIRGYNTELVITYEGGGSSETTETKTFNLTIEQQEIGKFSLL